MHVQLSTLAAAPSQLQPQQQQPAQISEYAAAHYEFVLSLLDAEMQLQSSS
jgi:hypothetical protein